MSNSITSTTTITHYDEFDFNGPIGIVNEYVCPVEVIGFKHDRFGISGARLRSGTGRTWWVDGDQLEDIDVQAVKA